MTLFTENPLERMMIQKPGDGRRGKSPPASIPPRCKGCPYNREPPCIGYCIRKLTEKKTEKRKEEF